MAPVGRQCWWRGALLHVCGPWCLIFLHAMNHVKNCVAKKLRGRGTPPIHRRYRWWRGMLKGVVAGTSPMGPYTDRLTGVQTPDDDERQPMAHTTRAVHASCVK